MSEENRAMELWMFGWAELLGDEQAELLVVSEPGAKDLALEVRYRVRTPAEMITVQSGLDEGE